ncbi:MAG: dTMP kinase [Spirochaetaceae bacterium]|nr:dTMP kinase [Spirochaetaceae bacterium]
MVLRNFIVFEGIDGSGTSTQLSLLKEKLQNHQVFFTAEPTDNPIGKFIRTILKGDVTLHPETTARLFAADRSEHIYGEKGIQELCQNNTFVFSDRYLFSSLAYQAITCGKTIPEKLNEDFPLPEYLFYFKLPVETALSRITARNGTREIFEKKEFLEKTSQEYDRVIEEYQRKPQAASKMNIITVDSQMPVEEIANFIWSIIEKLPIRKCEKTS